MANFYATYPLKQGAQNGQAIVLALTLVGLALCPVIEASLFWNSVPLGSQNLMLQDKKRKAPNLITASDVECNHSYFHTLFTIPLFPHIYLLIK